MLKQSCACVSGDDRHMDQQTEGGRPVLVVSDTSWHAYSPDGILKKVKKEPHVFSKSSVCLNGWVSCYCKLWTLVSSFFTLPAQWVSSELLGLWLWTGATPLVPSCCEVSRFWAEQLLDSLALQHNEDHYRCSCLGKLPNKSPCIIVNVFSINGVPLESPNQWFPWVLGSPLPSSIFCLPAVGELKSEQWLLWSQVFAGEVILLSLTVTEVFSVCVRLQWDMTLTAPNLFASRGIVLSGD